jgi:uncharacterized membrane protein (UPF0127 family)
MAQATKTYRLEIDDGRLVADQVATAESIWSRTLGLMFRSELPPGHGLCLRPCNSIHMFFMRIPLDVAFVDKEGRVVHTLHDIRPWRMSKIVRKAAAAIELPTGTLAQAGVQTGMILRMV